VVSSARQTRRRPGRPSADEEGLSASAILDAALLAFATHGYDGVSVRTLNRELGVSNSLLSQRFGSKEDLWRAAVDHGFGTISRHMSDVFDPTITDPLEQLALWIRRFLLFSAKHPELVALMNIEGRQDTPRLAYICDTYIGPSMGRIESLLQHLANTGRIRPTPLRAFHFLVAHGGAALFTLVPLAEHFDPASPLSPEAVEAHAELITELVIAGLQVPRPVPKQRRSSP
jgi:AcrR family transcriptional regulator